jgi:ABC-type Co2+ transport system permease subunit
MDVRPTRLTAGLAGVFSALTWPLVWPFFNDSSGSGTLWLMLGIIVLIALPAHAFVFGFKRPASPGRSPADSALLIRIVVWLTCGALVAIGLSVV